METRVFTFEMMGTDKLMEKSEGSVQRSLDDILAEGWEPMHWENVSQDHFVRYRAIMARKKSGAGGFGFGSARNA